MRPPLNSGPLVAAFCQGANEVSEEWQEMPQRLRGRGDWLKERGRIKDSELMYDAAAEIDALRQMVKTRRAAS